MTHSRNVLVLVSLLGACGGTPEAAPPAPTTPVAPVAEAVAAGPVASAPARFIPADAVVRFPAGEQRGIVGTDVVVRADRPEGTDTARCAAHLVLRAGDDVRDETVACTTPITFHGLTITVGNGLWTGSGLVELQVASGAPVDDPHADCATDADCVLARYSCCGAPPCDDEAYNVDVLRQQTDFCAMRICRPHEPRPCGAPPDPARVVRAACVAGVCQVSS